MNVTVNPRGTLEITGARIAFRNFRGLQSEFNNEGDRNFSLIISGGTFDDGRHCIEVDAETMAELLQKEENRYGAGWNVKIKAPRQEGDQPFIHLPVKVKFNERGPVVYVISGRNARRLDEDSIGMLDRIDILSVDLTIRPFDGEARFGPFRSAYLQSIEVTQDIDHIAARYADEEYPEE